MIISASRRTDIPAYYADWFFNRLRAGFALARNPVNPRQISRVALTPDAADGIVFWTKNPAPMLARLDELAGYTYYFQFSFTPYGKDIEPHVPDKRAVILPAFKRLSEAIGADRVLWRYDPILLNARYPAAYHAKAFEKMAAELCGHTRGVTVSFIDTQYREVRRNIKTLALSPFPEEARWELAAGLAETARRYGLRIAACAEPTVLQAYGIARASCVDGRLLATLRGRPLAVKKDRAQRPECGCAASVDIGAYNTCAHGCRYCYANYNAQTVNARAAGHDPRSPLIFGEVSEGDLIKDRG